MKIYKNNTKFIKFSLDLMPKLTQIFSNCPYQLCDYSAYLQLLIHSKFQTSYFINEDYIIMKYTYNDITFFLYPYVYNSNCESIDFKETEALELIDEYCIFNGIPLKFSTIPKDKINKLENRYPFISFYSHRQFCEYIYMIYKI